MVKRLIGKEERKQLRKTEERIARQRAFRKAGQRLAFRRAFGKKKSRAKKPSKRRMAASRAIRARRLLAAAGVKETRRGAGRPAGTYKYGMPIQEYKQLQRKRLEQIRRYREAQQMKYRRRGITPQQIQQMQLQRTMMEEEGGGEGRRREMPLQQQPQPQQQPQIQRPRKGDGPEKSVDEELEFNRWRAKEVLSPSAEAILTRLRKTQNMGKMANIRQQRILEERRIISEKGNLMKAHENMIDTAMDFTGVDETNILMAPNVFKESPENPHILKTNKLNLLQTREAGNQLKF